MYTTLLRLAWPYLMRFLAGQAADYLERRREQKQTESDRGDSNVQNPSSPPIQAQVSTGNAIWYSLSGVLLGSALSLMLYIILRDDHR